MCARQTSGSIVILNETSCSWSRASLAKFRHVSTALRAGHGMISHAESRLPVLTKCTRRQKRQIGQYVAIASRPFSGTPPMNVPRGNLRKSAQAQCRLCATTDALEELIADRAQMPDIRTRLFTEAAETEKGRLKAETEARQEDRAERSINVRNDEI